MGSTQAANLYAATLRAFFTSIESETSLQVRRDKRRRRDFDKVSRTRQEPPPQRLLFVLRCQIELMRARHCPLWNSWSRRLSILPCRFTPIESFPPVWKHACIWKAAGIVQGDKRDPDFAEFNWSAGPEKQLRILNLC